MILSRLTQKTKQRREQPWEKRISGTKEVRPRRNEQHTIDLIINSHIHDSRGEGGTTVHSTNRRKRWEETKQSVVDAWTTCFATDKEKWLTHSFRSAVYRIKISRLSEKMQSEPQAHTSGRRTSSCEGERSQWHGPSPERVWNYSMYCTYLQQDACVGRESRGNPGIGWLVWSYVQ